MLIGITGQIGAGKSTAALVLARMGAAIIDADKIGRDVVENNPRLVKQLAHAFGGAILMSQGKLNRNRTAQIAFSSKSNKRKLDRLVHPFLLRELQRQIKKLSVNYDVIVVDAALLLNWGLDKLVDHVLVIHSGEKQRFERLRKRGISSADARARQNMQLPYREFKKRADKVILNNTTKAALKVKVLNWAKPLFVPTNN
jgi:dephospho-CoA kinase